MEKQENMVVKTDWSRYYRVLSQDLKAIDSSEDTNLNNTIDITSKEFVENNADKFESETEATKGHFYRPHKSPTRYACSPCDVFFDNLDEVERHDHKRFICKYFCKKCMKKFNTKDEMIIHIKQDSISQSEKETSMDVTCTSHLINNELPVEESITHICDICCDGFNSLIRLNDHKALHEIDNLSSIKNEPYDLIDDYCITNDLEQNNDSIGGIQLEAHLKTEPSCTDIKTENELSLECHETFDESSVSSITNEPPCLSIPETALPNVQVDAGDTDQTSTLTPNAEITPLVPWLAPILPECPPYLIYGDQMFLRVNLLGGSQEFQSLSGPVINSAESQNNLSLEGTANSSINETNLENIQVSPPKNRSKLTSKSKAKHNTDKQPEVSSNDSIYLKALEVKSGLFEDKADQRNKLRFHNSTPIIQGSSSESTVNYSDAKSSISTTFPNLYKVQTVRNATEPHEGHIFKQPVVNLRETHSQTRLNESPVSKNLNSKRKGKKISNEKNSSIGINLKSLLRGVIPVSSKQKPKQLNDQEIGIEQIPSTSNVESQISCKTNESENIRIPGQNFATTVLDSASEDVNVNVGSSNKKMRRRSSRINVKNKDTSLAKVVETRSFRFRKCQETKNIKLKTKPIFENTNKPKQILMKEGTSRLEPNISTTGIPVSPLVTSSRSILRSSLIGVNKSKTSIYSCKDEATDISATDFNITASKVAEDADTRLTDLPNIYTRRYRCSICQAKYDNFPAIRAHCREVHSLMDKK